MDSAQAIVTVGSGIHRGQQTLPHAQDNATLFNIVWDFPFSDSAYTAVCSTQLDETSAFFV
jgi:hypothetical protein